MKASDRGRNVKSKELFGCFDECCISMFNSTKWNFSQAYKSFNRAKAYNESTTVTVTAVFVLHPLLLDWGHITKQSSLRIPVSV